MTMKKLCLSPLWMVGASMVLAACDVDDPLQPEAPELIGDAIAFGIWSPGADDTCSAAIHDQFSTVGPDGNRWAAWWATRSKSTSRSPPWKAAARPI